MFEFTLSSSHLLAHFNDGETEAQKSPGWLALLFPFYQAIGIPLDTSRHFSRRNGLGLCGRVDSARQKWDCGPRTPPLPFSTVRSRQWCFNRKNQPHKE